MVKRTKKPWMRPAPASELVAPIDAEFAQAVAGFYRQFFYGEKSDVSIASLGADDQAAARSLATGFIFIRQLLNREMEKPDADPNVVHAQELLDALIGGTDGPIRRYVSHLKSVNFGPQRAPANRTLKLRRSYIVGLVFALEKAASRDGKRISREKAIALVSEPCRQLGCLGVGRRGSRDRKVALDSTDTIKGWIRHGSAPAALDAAIVLLQEAESIAGRADIKNQLMGCVFYVGIRHIEHLFVPSLDRLLKKKWPSGRTGLRCPKMISDQVSS